MRIIAGRWRGRKLVAPKGQQTRPTADRTRETLFSMLASRLGSFEELRVADLYAGSGALGLEALSRGARSADFVETAGPALRALHDNAELLGALDAMTVHRLDAIRFVAALDPATYDVAFADPPYRRGFSEQVALRWLAIPFASVLGVEHASSEAMPEGGDTRRYGDTAITFYRA